MSAENKSFWLVEEFDRGPDINYDCDLVYITDVQPVHVNGHEVDCGELGQCNDAESHVVGCYGSFDKAMAELDSRYAEDGYRKVDYTDDKLSFLYRDGDVLFLARQGAYDVLDVETSETYCYDSLRDEVSGETTDEELMDLFDKWDAEFKADLDSELCIEYYDVMLEYRDSLRENKSA